MERNDIVLKNNSSLISLRYYLCSVHPYKKR